MIEAVFFDLDYTLHDMQRYLRGAYRDLARAVAAETGRSADRLFETLWQHWQRAGTEYGYLFNDWLAQHDLFTPERLRACIDGFHAHRPALALYPGADAVLRSLRGRYRLGLITDGHAGMQRAKVAALKLEDRFDAIVYADALGLSKPDARVFEAALAALGVPARAAVHVGDQPVRDVAGACRAGLGAIRMLTGEYRHRPDDPDHPPLARLLRLVDLPGALAGLAAEATLPRAESG